MGNQTSCEKKDTDDGSDNPSRKFVTTSLRGWRATQEDSYLSKPSIASTGKLKSWSMFGIFDGHAGDYVSKEVSKRLLDTFLDTDYVKALKSGKCEYVPGDIKKALSEAFVTLDKKLLEEWIKNQAKGVKEREEGKEMTNKEEIEFSREYESDSGCTATVCLITDDHIFFANAGDSRQVLVRYDKSWDGYRDSIHKHYENEKNEGLKPALHWNPKHSHNYGRHDDYQKWLENDAKTIRIKCLKRMQDLKDSAVKQEKKVTKRPHPKWRDLSLNYLLHNVIKFKNKDSFFQKDLDGGWIYPHLKRNSIGKGKQGYYYDYFATIDHKPTDLKEEERIKGAGGFVSHGRVDGNLAVSRAFGDFWLKADTDNDEDNIDIDVEDEETHTQPEEGMFEKYRDQPEKGKVTVVPDIEVIDRKCEEDAYIILGCDGIWDVIMTEQLKQFISYSFLSRKREDFKLIVEDTLDFILKLNSRDNLSLTVVKLDQCPGYDKDTGKNEQEMNQRLKDAIDCVLKMTNHDVASFRKQYRDPCDKLLITLYERMRTGFHEGVINLAGYENENKDVPFSKYLEDKDHSCLETIYGKDYIFPYGFMLKSDLTNPYMSDEIFGVAMSKYAEIKRYLVSLSEPEKKVESPRKKSIKKK